MAKIVAEASVEEKETGKIWVSRAMFDDFRADGFTPVKGDGPDGRQHWGDMVLMEAPASVIEARRERFRGPYESVINRINRGDAPMGEVSSPHAEFIFRRSREKASSRPIKD